MPAPAPIRRPHNTSSDSTERYIRVLEERLRILQGRLDGLMVGREAVVYACRPTGTFSATFVSDNVRDCLGWKPEDFTTDARFFLQRVHPGDRGLAGGRLGSVLKAGQQRLEYRIERADGTYARIRDELCLSRDAAGQPREIVGRFYDLDTEHGRREETAAEIDHQVADLSLLHRVAKQCSGRASDTDDLLARLTPMLADGLAHRASHGGRLRWKGTELTWGEPNPDFARRHDELRFLRGDLELVLYFTPSPNSERSATRELVQSLGETLATEFERHEDGQDDDVLERGLRQAVRAAKAGSWEWTLDRDDFWWSEELRRLYGLDADQPTPTHARFLEFVHPEDRSTTQAAIKAALKGQPYDVTHRLLLPGGLVRNVREMGQVIFDPAGRPERLSGVSVDVSEATQAKEDLDLFFAATDELLCVATMDGYFKRINPAWTQLLGYTRQELTSRPFTDFVHPDDRLRTAEAMGVLANGEKVKGFINRYRAADGRYLSMQWNALTGPDGSTIYAVARDVTEAQQAKRKLVATEAQLLQAQKMESVGLLAGGIAHDFNNLLLAIVGYAALVQEELQPESQTWEDAQQILIAGERAGALTRQLLAFSRRQVTVTEEVDLGSVLLHLRKMLIRIIGENIELRIDAETERLWVVADRGQLEQIIVNLAVNARDAMPKGGTLWIALDSAPDQSLPESPSKLDSSTGSVLIRVRDDGVGMSPTTRTRIFEPFFTTKPAGHGTGLGLSTVFGIVQQLEGRIEVDSAPGKGTEFRVYLPRLAPAQNPTPAQAQTQMAPTSRTLGQGLGALVVEDDGAVRELVRRALERTGFHVSLAANAGEGLLLAERATSNFDVMVLDLVMPHLDGLGLAKRLRAAHPNCPILFITGYVDLDKVGNPVDVPASELLLKPFTPTELADKICQLLGLNPGS